MSFWVGLILGISLSNIVTGLVLIWSDRPKRNCDVGTPIQQYYRFQDYHAKHINSIDRDMCKGCPLEGEMKAHDCRFVWMNMPYKKEDKQ